MQFEDLKIIEPILKALKEEKYSTPLLYKKINSTLLDRNDVLGSAQTGTGKTAAFAIQSCNIYITTVNNKIVHDKLMHIITPTRELAIQIADSFTTYSKYTGLKNTVILEE